MVDEVDRLRQELDEARQAIAALESVARRQTDEIERLRAEIEQLKRDSK